jgi:hypothetical protein
MQIIPMLIFTNPSEIVELRNLLEDTSSEISHERIHNPSSHHF